MAIEMHPDNYEAHFMLGQIYKNERDYVKMMEHFNESLKYSNKKRGEIDRDKRVTYNNLYNEGTRALSMAQSSEDPELRKTSFEETIKQMETALIISKDLNAIEAIGVAYRGLEQEDEAEKYFKQVLAINPKSRNTLMQMGNMKFIQATMLESELAAEQDSIKKSELEEKSKALFAETNNYYSELVTYYPEELKDAIAELALSYEKLGQYDEALKLYEEALKDDPENNGLIIQLGVTKYKMGDVDGALEDFKKALQKDPDNLSLNKTIAISLWEKAFTEKINKGEMLSIEEAATTLPYMEKVVELDDNDFDMWNGIAIINAQLAQKEVTGAGDKMRAAFNIFMLFGEVAAGTDGAEEKLEEAK